MITVTCYFSAYGSCWHSSHSILGPATAAALSSLDPCSGARGGGGWAGGEVGRDDCSLPSSRVFEGEGGSLEHVTSAVRVCHSVPVEVVMKDSYRECVQLV